MLLRMIDITDKHLAQSIIRNIHKRNVLGNGWPVCSAVSVHLREAFSSDKNELPQIAITATEAFRSFRVTAIFLQCDSAPARFVPPTFRGDLREIGRFSRTSCQREIRSRLLLLRNLVLSVVFAVATK